MREATRLHHGWTVRRKENRFLEMRGEVVPAMPVVLPHDALIGERRAASNDSATAYFPAGVYEYVTTIHAPLSWRDRRVSLFFEGVYRDALVFVNDDLVVAHPYGYTEFLVPLDAHLRFDADNVVRVEARVHDDARWYTGCGIHRPVHLVITGPVHIAHDGVTVTTPEVDEHGAVVAIATTVRNETAHTCTVRVRHEVAAADGTIAAVGSAPLTLRPSETAVARQRLYLAGAARWDVDDPHLYECRTTLGVDDGEGGGGAELDAVTDRFGVRTVTVDPQHGLRINGRTVKLRGACIHHDNGPLGAAAIDRAEERRVEILKASGFNAIRAAHNPLSRSMLDACDRLGVLVMDEAFDVWTESKRDHDHSLRFLHTWRDDVAAMVRKDRNRPSVIMYSTGNEIPEVGSAHGAALARDIAEHVRSLDPTRFVTNAVQPILSIRGLIPLLAGKAAAEHQQSIGDAENMGVNSILTSWEVIKKSVLKDPLVGHRVEEVAASLDVVGYNYLDERYELDGDLHPHRVIVGSETYPKAIGECWPLIERNPHVIGDFTWTGWDYLGEVGIGRTDFLDDGQEHVDGGFAAPFPWLTAHCGDVDILGARTPQSYYREIVFGLRQDPYIAVHRPEHRGQRIGHRGPWSWNDVVASWSWPIPEGTEVVIDVYCAGDEVEVLVGGSSHGRRPTGVEHDYRTEFSVGYRRGEVVAIGYRDGAEIGRQVLRSADGDARLAVRAERERIAADDAELAYVLIAVTGDNGVVDMSVTRSIEVSVEGPGVLQGLASADPKSLHPFTGTTCQTFDGTALAVIRPTGDGEITVTATADGLAPASVVLQAVAS